MSEYYKFRLFNHEKYEEILPALESLIQGSVSAATIMTLFHEAQLILNSEEFQYFNLDSDIQEYGLLIQRGISLAQSDRLFELAREKLVNPYDETSRLVECIVTLLCFPGCQLFGSQRLGSQIRESSSGTLVEMKGSVFVFNTLSEIFQTLMDELMDMSPSNRAISSISEIIILRNDQIEQLRQALQELVPTIMQQSILRLDDRDRRNLTEICERLLRLVDLVQSSHNYTIAMQVTY
jgi:hypothetical protein